ncbi:DHA1 family inner membrane transport protein [Kribbella amoyensis]|uniref:DHA1 family inner membrane transport protein n=1 Tax=Kribbella amoyensis TaxID=996641 RepID=A0A561BMD4_9ACTN|nr:DHA1 family inner membrane transport protein [Kribbella amoyensis]
MLALGFGACAIGFCELAAIGVLGLVGDDLRSSVAATGYIVTAYALGVCVGGPLLAVATARMDRRSVLLAALSAFVVANVATAVAPSLAFLVVLRLVAGSIHGLYVGFATSHAAALAAPHRRGGAVALVFGGIAVATVLGAPLGRLFGEALGWRAAFWVVAAVSAVALIVVAGVVPSVREAVGAEVTGTLRAAMSPRVVAFLGLILLVMGGVFSLYTYVTEFLEHRTGTTGAGVSAVLLAFGLASAVGTILGGRLADRSAVATMTIGAGIATVALGALAVVGSSPVVVTVCLVVCGLSAFAYIPAFQLRLMSLAAPATDLAATLGASAANAGIALGAVAGGAALARGTDALVVVACALCAAGFIATLLVGRPRR